MGVLVFQLSVGVVLMLNKQSAGEDLSAGVPEQEQSLSEPVARLLLGSSARPSGMLRPSSHST